MKPLPANISLLDFGKAMSQLRLSDIPAHNRTKALIDHLMRIQQDTIIDRKVAAEIEFSRRLKQ